MITRLLFCFLSLLISISAFSNNNDTLTSILKKNGETISFSGIVVDENTGNPLPDATVAIPDLRIGAMSDNNGKFRIDNIPKGIYLLQVSYEGYATFTQQIDFSKINFLKIQLKESSLENADVIITGVSKATEIKRDPVPIVTLNKISINQNAGAGNVIDEIARLPGVSAVSTGPNISKPVINGLGYNRVVTAEDGIRQEGQQWGGEHGVEVDQNSIDRIEIIKGPASLSFGSDAIAGVVNLITAAPVAEGKILGSVTGIYGTNNGLVNGSFKLQGNEHGLVWGTVISEKAAKNYQNPHDGRVYASNFHETDARAMVGITKSWGYSYLNASLFNDVQAIPDGSRDAVTRQFTQQITDADTVRTIVPQSVLNSYQIPVLHQLVQLYRVYDNSSIHLGKGNLFVNLGYQYSHRREFTHPQNADIPGLNLGLTTLTYDVKYDFDLGKNYETTVGVNGMYQNNALGSNSTDFPIPAYRQFDIGSFAIVKKSFGKLDVSAGVRYDHRSFNGKAADIDTSVEYFPSLYTGLNPSATQNIMQQFSVLNKNFSGVTGSIGATYNFSDAFLIKANIARGYRAPNVSELSANGADPGSGMFNVGNRNFKPEFSLQEDFGMFLTLSNVSASIEVYDNHLSNYIFQQQILDATGNPERVNADGSANPNGLYTKFTYVQTKARIDGGDVNLDIHPISWLHFANSLTLTYGTNLGSGSAVPDSLKYLPTIPPLHTHSELRGSFTKGFSRFRDTYAFIGFDHYNAQDRFFAAYGTETYTAGYNLLSAGVGCNIVNKRGSKILELYIEGTNLANIAYQSNMSRLKYMDNPVVPAGIQSGIFDMGRSISFKVIVPFEIKKKG